jgi:hypothetical protein
LALSIFALSLWLSLINPQQIVGYFHVTLFSIIDFLPSAATQRMNTLFASVVKKTQAYYEVVIFPAAGSGKAVVYFNIWIWAIPHYTSKPPNFSPPI